MKWFSWHKKPVSSTNSIVDMAFHLNGTLDSRKVLSIQQFLTMLCKNNAQMISLLCYALWGERHAIRPRVLQINSKLIRTSWNAPQATRNSWQVNRPWELLIVIVILISGFVWVKEQEQIICLEVSLMINGSYSLSVTIDFLWLFTWWELLV